MDWIKYFAVNFNPAGLKINDLRENYHFKKYISNNIISKYCRDIQHGYEFIIDPINNTVKTEFYKNGFITYQSKYINSIWYGHDTQISEYMGSKYLINEYYACNKVIDEINKITNGNITYDNSRFRDNTYLSDLCNIYINMAEYIIGSVNELIEYEDRYLRSVELMNKYFAEYTPIIH